MLEVLYTFTVEGILKSVASLAAQEISLFRGLKKELYELSISLMEIEEYLGDVGHQPQYRGMAVRDWVKKLKDVAHDADDVLEAINYEVLRRKVEIQNHMKKKVLNFFSLSNPILFRQKIAHKIKNINASLAVLKIDASFIGLVARRIDPTPPSMGNRETVSSFGHDEKTIGREKIVSDIIATLIESKNREKNPSVQAIVGMGGLGKTTLARSIFNDDAIGRHFVEKMWVCVSDTFEVNSILNRMLESLNSNRTGVRSLNNLKEGLTGKRYILVLDDVWIEDDELWNDFMSCLSRLNSAPGSIAIVTTRSAKIASITETMPRCDLESLSVDDCWSILKSEAFPNGASPLDPTQENIGRAIAAKCAGVPLVAKVLGSEMRSKHRTSEWSSIRESQIWQLPNINDKIMSVLKLSFDNSKSPSLKQCFAYCSILKKDIEIERDDLVQLWMAQGYLISSRTMSMEDVGNEYFNILLQNSLFQVAREDRYDIITKCKMHDFMHDLAEEVFQFECLTQDMDQMDDDAREIQHVGHISSRTLERIPQGSIRRLRSLFVDCKVPSNIFERFRCLRMLNLSDTEIEELPHSIRKLKRLRYLNISCTRIKELPKSMGKLYNLQTLRMSNIDNLKTFPREMENLINLRHVYFDEDKEVPFGMTRLTHMQTLPSFILDKDGHHRLDELGGLNKLKGKLVIGSLECVRDKEEAAKSNLVGKANLRELELKWRRDHSVDLDEDILEGLQPHPNLESLSIEGFKGTKFASWMMSDSLLINLTEIKLICLRECEAVPPLGYLVNLRRISIKQCPKLKSFPISQSQSLEELRIVGCRKLRCTSIHSMPSLRKLVIERCTSLEESKNLQSTTSTTLQRQQEDLSLNGYTSLQELTIQECNGFTSILSGLHSCTSLSTLDIYGCPNLRTLSGHGLQTPVSLENMSIQNCPNLEALPKLDNLTSLATLFVSGCGNLTSLGDQDVSSMQSLSFLDLSFCRKLQCLPKGLHSLSHLKRMEIGAFWEELDSFPDFQVPSQLEKLKLYGWPKLKSLPQQIQHLTSLTSLSISYFDGVETLPEWLGNLTSLTQLKIWNCANLLYLPTVEAMQRLTKLHELRIADCPRLSERCTNDSDPEWSKISHIRKIKVGRW